MRGIFYARGNSLLKRFRHCNTEIKIKLFKSYCTSFYCLNMWSRFTLYNYRKVRSAYHRIFRNLMNIDRDAMLNFMVNNSVKSFQEIERTLIYSLRNRVALCENKIVTIKVICLIKTQTCASSQQPFYSLLVTHTHCASCNTAASKVFVKRAHINNQYYDISLS